MQKVFSDLNHSVIYLKKLSEKSEKNMTILVCYFSPPEENLTVEKSQAKPQ